MLQYECELVKELKKEAAELREKLSTMEGYGVDSCRRLSHVCVYKSSSSAVSKRF